ncbi:hypothetical protein Tco_0088178 [Tanacetum coccineum]
MLVGSPSGHTRLTRIWTFAIILLQKRMLSLMEFRLLRMSTFIGQTNHFHLGFVPVLMVTCRMDSSSEVEPKKVRKNNDAPIIEDWVSDDEDEVESPVVSNSQLNDKGFVNSGCSRHMTGNITHLSYFKDFDGGYVTFGGGAYGGRITSKGTIKIDNLDFDDVYFVKELKFNLFSVSQMCDKKNYVLFTNYEC